MLILLYAEKWYTKFVEGNKYIMITSKIEKMQRAKEMCEMYNSGTSLEAIGKHFSLTRSRVQQLLKKQVEYKPRHKDTRKTKICKECKKDFTYESIKNTIGHTYCITCREDRKQWWCISMKLVACVGCNKSDSKHYARGFCRKCVYSEPQMRNLTRIRVRKYRTTEKYREYIKKYHKTEQYKKYHREYSKKLYLKRKQNAL